MRYWQTTVEPRTILPAYAIPAGETVHMELSMTLNLFIFLVLGSLSYGFVIGLGVSSYFNSRLSSLCELMLERWMAWTSFLGVPSLIILFSLPPEFGFTLISWTVFVLITCAYVFFAGIWLGYSCFWQGQKQL